MLKIFSCPKIFDTQIDSYPALKVSQLSNVGQRRARRNSRFAFFTFRQKEFQVLNVAWFCSKMHHGTPHRLDISCCRTSIRWCHARIGPSELSSCDWIESWHPRRYSLWFQFVSHCAYWPTLPYWLVWQRTKTIVSKWRREIRLWLLKQCHLPCFSSFWPWVFWWHSPFEGGQDGAARCCRCRRSIQEVVRCLHVGTVRHYDSILLIWTVSQLQIDEWNARGAEGRLCPPTVN